jgi:hypothetical protein
MIYKLRDAHVHPSTIAFTDCWLLPSVFSIDDVTTLTSTPYINSQNNVNYNQMNCLIVRTSLQ